MIPDHLRLQPGQEALTTAQEREAESFARARIEAQLSTEPVDEPEVEQLLQQAYEVAGLPPPERIHWVDGPLPLMAALTLKNMRDNVYERVFSRVRKACMSACGPTWGSACMTACMSACGPACGPACGKTWGAACRPAYGRMCDSRYRTTPGWAS